MPMSFDILKPRVDQLVRSHCGSVVVPSRCNFLIMMAGQDSIPVTLSCCFCSHINKRAIILQITDIDIIIQQSVSLVEHGHKAYYIHP